MIYMLYTIIKIKMKLFSVLLLITLLASCSSNVLNDSTISWNNTVVMENNDSQWSLENSAWEDTSASDESDETQQTEFKQREIELNLKDSDTVKVSLDSQNTQINTDSIQLSWQIVTIKKSWNYEFSWVLNNGQIVVETEDEKDVQIILSWVEIKNNFWPAILVNQAEQTLITVSENTTNTLSDGKGYSIENEDDGTGAAIFSKDDLVIQGKWTLEVSGNYADGIVSKDKLFISWVEIILEAQDDGIRWKDYLLIEDSTLDIVAVADWLKSNDDEKATMVINSWNITVSAWDDAFHSEIYLVFNGWNINIKKSYEWIEAKFITFNDGNIQVVSSDDGINATWGSSTSGNEQFWWNNMWNQWFDRSQDDNRELMRQIMDKQISWEELTEEESSLLAEMKANRPQRWSWFDMWNRQMMWGWGWMHGDDGAVVYMNGWNIVLNSNGDGFDSNGRIIMTWWKITIFWPEGNGNGAIDYNGTFEITWWEVIAIGSSGMVQTPWESDELNTINIWLSSTYGAWESIVLKDNSWNILYSVESIKQFQNIVISSSLLQTWSTYTLEIWWTQIQEITINDKITKVGTFNSRWGR